MFRVMSERLARAGVAVLRFDYGGTGDSEGGDLDFSLAQGAADLLVAHQKLISLAAPLKVVWISVRLGASMALKALSDAALMVRPQHVVAWEPVLDGSRYLQHLRYQHVDALEASYTVADPSWRRKLAEDPEAFRDEAMGFAMSSELQAELAAFTLASVTPIPCRQLSVVAPSGCIETAALRAEPHLTVGRLTTVNLDHDFNWTSEEALNTALVPAQAVQCLFDLCIGS